MKKKTWFILLIIIEAIFVCFISVSRRGWDFVKDIVLAILIFNVILTVIIAFIAKNSKDNIKNNKKKLIILIITIIILKSIIVIFEYFYTKQLTSDVINMYSVSFLENINSFDELYDALNISDKEKNLLKNNEDAYNTWIHQYRHNPLIVLMYLTPLGDQCFFLLNHQELYGCLILRMKKIIIIIRLKDINNRLVQTKIPA